MKYTSKGFSLIELLIVISIIAVLSTIAVASFGSLQKNSRDLKRQADLKLVQGALEQYYADQHYYPTATSVTFDGSSLTGPGSRVYLNKTPIDPTTGQTYVYQAKPGTCANTANTPSTYCLNYCLYAKLENSKNANGTPLTTSACTPTPAGYNYLVTKP